MPLCLDMFGISSKVPDQSIHLRFVHTEVKGFHFSCFLLSQKPHKHPKKLALENRGTVQNSMDHNLPSDREMAK